MRSKHTTNSVLAIFVASLMGCGGTSKGTGENAADPGQDQQVQTYKPVLDQGPKQDQAGTQTSDIVDTATAAGKFETKIEEAVGIVDGVKILPPEVDERRAPPASEVRVR